MFALIRTACAAVLIASGLQAETKLGQPFTLTETTPIPAIHASPASYVGKVVQVKGKITAVCQKTGCWMELVDPSSGKSLRVKVKDGEIVFPKEAAGKLAVAEGKLIKFDLSREAAVARAKHDAEEQGIRFDPASVRGPVTLYQIQGTGVVLLD